MVNRQGIALRFTGLVREAFFHFPLLGVEGNQLIPTLADVCASFQHAVFSHICKRLQRGMVWTDMNDLLPSTSKKLVCINRHEVLSISLLLKACVFLG